MNLSASQNWISRFELVLLIRCIRTAINLKKILVGRPEKSFLSELESNTSILATAMPLLLKYVAFARMPVYFLKQLLMS